MRTISWATLRNFGATHEDALVPLRNWYRIAERADWSCFADVRADFPSADQLGERLIFNIKGNHYRLVVAVDYPDRVILVKWVGTHAEYDRIDPRTI